MNKPEFNSMVVQQAESLKTYAFRFTYDEEDVNDLVQDTMLKPTTNCNKFKDGSNLKGWLYTIMRNTFINNYRRLTKVNTLVTKYLPQICHLVLRVI